MIERGIQQEQNSSFSINVPRKLEIRFNMMPLMETDNPYSIETVFKTKNKHLLCYVRHLYVDIFSRFSLLLLG